MRAILASFLIFAAVALVFAASGTEPAPTDTKPHAPMEFFGIGPEMADNRGGAWIDTLGNLAEKAIAKIGVIAAAIILLQQNISNKKRLDNQRADINHIAAVASVPLPSQTAVAAPTP